MPDRRHLRHRRLGAAWALLTLAGGTGLWACGPGLSGWLLGDEKQVLAYPRTCLWKEQLDELLPGGARLPPPRLRSAKEPPEEPLDVQGAQHTAAAEEADLTLALWNNSPKRRKAILDRVGILRASFRAVDAFSQPGVKRPRIEATLPAGLPAEIDDYLAGAIAYHEERFEDARKIWESLLARPAAERRQRSVWAAFMLGRTALRQTPGKPEDPAEALRRFAAVKQLVQEGFPDRLGLAAASRGWEARAELDRGRYDRAAEMYFELYAAADETAAASLDRVCRAARTAGRPALVAMARSPIARVLMTAMIEPSDTAWAADWLAAVKEAGVTATAGADGLACVAYAAGDWKAAQTWVDRAPKNAPLAAWIRAKLLLRQGRPAAAAAFLGRASREHGLPMGEQPAADAGVVEVALGRYAAALTHLRARDGAMGADAAYVAERLMTSAELAAYVDRLAPAASVTSATSATGNTTPGSSENQRLRDLLARRLARAGRFREARRYLRKSYRPALDRLVAGLKAEHQAKLPAKERASRLFAAACAARRDGMEVLATEADPDWALDDGMFDRGAFPEPGDESWRGKVLPPNPAGERRAAQSRAHPDKRFHYRYQAADLARRAAAFLPDGTEEKASYLATAGSWLKRKDPQAALPFYRALERCCGETPTGRAARAIHWFPDINACPATPTLPVP
jgi:hypothetical protein